MEKLKILITGGAGFIGSHLAGALLEDDRIFSVTVLDNLSTGKMTNVHCYEDHPKYHFAEGDIRDGKWCGELAGGMDVILHHAALGSVPRSVVDPLTTNKVNVSGSLNILRAAAEKGVKKVILASSSSVYGDRNILPQKEEITGNPLSPYAVSKRSMEEYTRVFQKTYGLNYIIFRYFNVFGERQPYDNPYAAVIPLFCRAISKGRAPIVYGDGTTTRDFTHIDNIIEASKLAIFTNDEKAINQTYNIACGRTHSLLKALEILQNASGINIAPVFEPERKGDIKHSFADISKAEQRLGYHPVVHFEEGLRKVYEEYRG